MAVVAQAGVVYIHLLYMQLGMRSRLNRGADRGRYIENTSAFSAQEMCMRKLRIVEAGIGAVYGQRCHRMLVGKQPQGIVDCSAGESRVVGKQICVDHVGRRMHAIFHQIPHYRYPLCRRPDIVRGKVSGDFWNRYVHWFKITTYL